MGFCSYGGQQFLIVVDCFTDWPGIIPMQYNTSTQHLTQALNQSFCRTAVPDVMWSDGSPQFTSKLFNNFSKQCKTSSSHYPQSNGKIEATVKSMKKIITTSSCATTHHLAKMDNPMHRNCTVDLYKTHCQHIAAPLHQSGNAVPLKLNNWQHTPWHSLSHSVTHMHNISQISIWSQLSPSIIPGQTFGTYMAQ